MNRLFWLMVIALTWMIHTTVYSQSSDDILRLLLEKEMITQEDIDMLKEQKKDSAQTKVLLNKIKSAFKSEIFQLSGYGQFLYQATEDAPVNNTMRVNRLILFASGKLNPHFGYLMMYDFGPNPALHELYGEYTPKSYAGIRFGQFKVPFTIENPMSPTRWESVYGSLSVNALAGISTDVIGAKAGRDMGIQLSGKCIKKDNFYLMEYYAGLFNGTGINTRDNNNHKDFAGTLILFPVKELKVAGSIYSGKAYYDIENPLAGTNRQNHVRNRWSAGTEYDSKHIYARAEYLNGNDGGMEREGYYGVGMYKILPQKLDIFGKYDYYNPEKSNNSLETSEITAGVNFYFAFLSRVQLNYIYSDSKLTGNNQSFVAQLQVFF